jgi:hypothetical protein
VGDDVSVDSEMLLVSDFVNLKIKSTQSFRGAHRDRMYVHVFIEVSVYMCINMYVYTVFLKKEQNTQYVQRVHIHSIMLPTR